MSRTFLVSIALITTLLAAQAVTGSQGTGHFRTSGLFHLEGVSTFGFTRPYITTVAEAQDGFSFTLSANEVRIDRAWTEAFLVRAPNPVRSLTIEHDFEIVHETIIRHDVIGETRAVRPAGGWGGMLVVWGEGATAHADGSDVSTVLQLARHGKAHPFDSYGRGEDGNFWAKEVPIPHAHFVLERGVGPIEIEGDFSVYLFNVLWDLRSAEGDESYETGYRSGETGFDRIERQVLTVLNGRMLLAAEDVEVRSDSLSAEVLGGVSFGKATGYYDRSGLRHEARDQRAVFDGVFQVHARAVDGGADGPGAFVGLQGDLRSTNLPASPAPQASSLAATAAVGATVALAAAASVALRFLPFWHTRIRAEDLLQAPVRRRIYDAVLAAPGLHKRELARRSGLGWGAFLLELHRLEKHGYLRTEKRGRNVVVFATASAGAPPSPVPHPVRRRVFEAVPEVGEVTLGDVARALALSRQLTGYHLTTLEREGRVASRREGAYRMFRRV